jgi:hypothetical protein
VIGTKLSRVPGDDTMVQTYSSIRVLLPVAGKEIDFLHRDGYV